MFVFESRSLMYAAESSIPQQKQQGKQTFNQSALWNLPERWRRSELSESSFKDQTGAAYWAP